MENISCKHLLHVRVIHYFFILHTSSYFFNQKLTVFYFHEQSSFYRPQRSCGQGYVFTRVCDSVHSGGSPENPPTPPGTRQTHPPPDQGEPPLAGRTPPNQGEPPQYQGEPPQNMQTPPGPGSPHRTRENPPGPRRTPPGRRLQHTVNERPVRILLECILVPN